MDWPDTYPPPFLIRARTAFVGKVDEDTSRDLTMQYRTLYWRTPPDPDQTGGVLLEVGDRVLVVGGEDPTLAGLYQAVELRQWLRLDTPRDEPLRCEVEQGLYKGVYATTKNQHIRKMSGEWEVQVWEKVHANLIMKWANYTVGLSGWDDDVFD